MFSFVKNIDKWKEKAKIRRLEIKALKKRIQELYTSRNNWKNKAEGLSTKIEKDKKKFELLQERRKKAKAL